jgi:hypothetical protein
MCAWRVTMLRSFDHLIRPHQQRLRDRESEHLRGLEIDHQLELGEALDGKVGIPRMLRGGRGTPSAGRERRLSR